MKVDVWVSGGLDTQNIKGTQISLSWFGLLNPTYSGMVFFVLGVPNQGITIVK